MITNVLKQGDRIEVRKLDRSIPNNEFPDRSVSRLLEMADESNVVIEEFVSEGEAFLPETGERYELRFISASGSFACRAEVIDSNRRGGKGTVEARILSDLIKDKKRKFFRLEKLITFSFTTDNGTDGESFEGILSNISAGGIKFSSSQELKRDDIIYISLFLDDYAEESYQLKAKVIYSDMVANKNMAYEHRAMFLDLDFETQEKMVRFVFREDRKQYK